ncbi:MAG TPA: hypothetical protein VHR66_28770 [Gemmataceae bacterium]|jgi:hypothetical protein|nr:hypothetical protein [Gemmataceae bacterium]
MYCRAIPALCAVVCSLALTGCGKDRSSQTEATDEDAAVLVDLPGGERVEVPTVPRIDAKKELAALEAKAIEQFPAPALIREAPPAVVEYLAVRTATRRAAWVVKETALPKAKTPPPLNTNDLSVGQFGRINSSFEIVRIEDDAVLVKNHGGALFAYVGIKSSGLVAGSFLPIAGTYEVYRTGTFGADTLPVIRSKSLWISKDPGRIELADTAEGRLKDAEAKEFAAQRKLEAARNAAMEKALTDATAEAKKKVPIPTNATAQDQIRARLMFENLERQLQDAARDKVREMYSVPK